MLECFLDNNRTAASEVSVNYCAPFIQNSFHEEANNQRCQTQCGVHTGGLQTRNCCMAKYMKVIFNHDSDPTASLFKAFFTPGVFRVVYAVAMTPLSGFLCVCVCDKTQSNLFSCLYRFFLLLWLHLHLNIRD